MALSEFIEKLEKRGHLIKIKTPVSLKYEVASVIKRFDGRAIFFDSIKESQYKVAANLCSSRDLVSMALDCKKEELVEKIANAIDNPKKFSIGKNDYVEIEKDLKKLPILTHYEIDGGPYISSAIVIAHDSEWGDNASFHRMMVVGSDEAVIRIVPRHLNEFLKKGNREVAICIGSDVQMLIAAAISCEIGKSELEIANSIKETKFSIVDGHIVPDSEFVIIADITEELRDEGKFVDLTGTYDIVRKQPLVKIKRIYAKKNPVYHALLPAGLEHKTLMGMPREPTIFREVNKVCECIDVFLPPGGCSWLHGIVKIKKRGDDDGKKAIEAAFRGHSSMKHVVVVDDDIDIFDPNSVEWAIATRVQADRDLVIKPNEKGSSLDPSSDPNTRETCKVGIDATIPWGKNREDFIVQRIPLKINLEDLVIDETDKGRN